MNATRSVVPFSLVKAIVDHVGLDTHAVEIIRITPSVVEVSYIELGADGHPVIDHDRSAFVRHVDTFHLDRSA